MRQWRVIGRLWVLGLLFGCLAAPVHAIDLKEKLSAVYIVNIAKFVAWPNGADSVNVCVFEDSAIFKSLQLIDGRKIDKRRNIKVYRLPAWQKRCDIRYWAGDVHSYPLEQSDEILDITHSADEFDHGADILFFVENNKLRFSINRKSLEKHAFSIRSELLNLSRELR